ncbi:MAG: hypothetical protein P4K98_01885 [Bryobacteraceae bacterium]|nr:hypothetical protein [Bryobacteraceae bacterium]
MVLFGTLLKPQPTGPAAPPLPLAVIGSVMAAVLAALSVWGIWTAVAIFRRRGWARVSIVVFAALLTFIGASASLVILFMPFPAQGGVSQRMMDTARWGIAGFYGVLAVIGVWWLVLFNLGSTKEYFAQASHSEPPARPLSVSVIAWWLLAGSLMCMAPAVMRAPAVVFGVVMTGWSALAAYLAFAVAQLLLGTGLLRLKEPARLAAIAYFCLTALSAVLALAPPGFAARMQIMQREMPRLYPAATSAQMFQSGWVFVLPGIVLAAVPVWFLVRQHGAFVKSATAQQQA